MLQITRVLKRRTGDAIQEVRRITGDLSRSGAEKTLQSAQDMIQHLRQETRRISDAVQAGQQRLTTQLAKVLDLGERIVQGELL